MKKLLLLVGLVVMVSGSVLASDVRGVNLVCVGDTSKLKFYAFSIIYQTYPRYKWRISGKDGSIIGEGIENTYKEYPKEIVFERLFGSPSFVVNRKTLELFRKFSNEKIELIGQCEITKDDPFELMKTMLEEEIEKIEEGNQF